MCTPFGRSVVITPAIPLRGEFLVMPERLIVAPAVGVFRPRPVARGARIYEGEVVGHIIGPGTSLPVRSPFGGTLMGCSPRRVSGCARANPSPGC
jgi:hypothetical protein